MSAAPNYTPETSFADDETNNVAGRSLVKTDSLDSELANISTSINALNVNQQAIQRDDGKLADSTVEPYALAEQTRALIATSGCNPRGVWQPNTVYAFKDIVQRSNIAQICLQSHNSGTSFTQSFWLPISGDGTSAANAAAAAASASAAATSQTNAAASATSASASASAASTSASNASTSATNAANSASSATTSATSATNSATAAATSASNAAASAASITAPLNATNDPTFASTSGSNAASPEWFRGALNATGGAPMFACRAWVTFNGTGAGAIVPLASGNVSSITDNGTGDYTINFTTAMQDINYATQVTTQRSVTNSFGYGMIIQGVAPTTTSVRVGHSVGAGAFDDPSRISVSIFR